ncbi:unnamed protein product [Moneuplotes crassus]|uniref:B box-type domain-containing protein n=1 Tax=Euplotes crassus TaxID=5936 RepID=A0AAD1URF0_EUPCR|nr:unnamed protein product [Moneuplotes crassus]
MEPTPSQNPTQADYVRSRMTSFETWQRTRSLCVFPRSPRLARPGEDTRRSLVKQNRIEANKCEEKKGIQISEQDNKNDSLAPKSPSSSSFKTWLLSCPLCKSEPMKTCTSCRFCGFYACEGCWTEALEKEEKCFRCRKGLKRKDLVKNLMYGRIREEEVSLEGRLRRKMVRKCPEHGEEGKLFCERCEGFVCLECVREDTHAGHDFLDVEENREVKEKLLGIVEFCRELEKGCELLDMLIQEHLQFLDIKPLSQEGLDFLIKGKIDSCENKSILKRALEDILESEISLHTEAEKELKNFQEIVKDIINLSLKTTEIDKLIKKLNESLDDKDLPNIKTLITPKTPKFIKKSLSDQFMLTSEYTQEPSFTIFISTFLTQHSS